MTTRIRVESDKEHLVLLCAECLTGVARKIKHGEMSAPDSIQIEPLSSNEYTVRLQFIFEGSEWLKPLDGIDQIEQVTST